MSGCPKESCLPSVRRTRCRVYMVSASHHSCGTGGGDLYQEILNTGEVVEVVVTVGSFTCRYRSGGSGFLEREQVLVIL